MKTDLFSLFRRLPAAVALALAVSALPAAAQTPIDPYGGVVRNVAPATGFFQVKQVGDRWMFVTPDGNGMWMTAVFGVISPDWLNMKERIAAKYGAEPDWILRHWRVHTARRLKGWGFNTLSAYHHWGLRPGPRADPNPEAMPYIHIINPARYVLKHDPPFGSGPVKDIVFGTDPVHHDGWRGSRMLDFFDPNFESYIDGWMRGDAGLHNGDIGNPWMVGIAMDEGDTLFGFGPGLDVPAPRLHTHPGLVALVTSPEQACNPFLGSSTPSSCSPVAPYAERKVYTKYAVVDFLKSRYPTIDALNVAWGSSYTTFDSAGGWGTGTGLLDENGRNAWIGKWYDEMASATPAFRADLDDFLYLYAKRYFTVMAGKMRQYAPGHLVFGPTSLNNWGGLTRKPILKAAGESVDVLQATINSQQVLDLTAASIGNKPIVTWDSFVANPDSALCGSPDNCYRDTVVDFGGHTRLAPAQGERAQLYAWKLDSLFNQWVTPSGVHPVAGMTLWAWSDHWGEKANFGLVTFAENAYDGQEATQAPGVDAWGWPTGGEEGNYGDFLSGVTNANARVVESMMRIGVLGNAMIDVESPQDGAVVARRLSVSGWALDGRSATGPGVDLVRIFRGRDCAGTLLADATMGTARPDIQATLGLPASFATTGFTATFRLPSTGPQRLTVCARSTVTGTFDAQQTLSLTSSRRARR
jgi:hypothetical protein